MDQMTEEYLRELAFLNRGNKKLLEKIRFICKMHMNLRRDLASVAVTFHAFL